MIRLLSTIYVIVERKLKESNPDRKSTPLRVCESGSIMMKYGVYPKNQSIIIKNY